MGVQRYLWRFGKVHLSLVHSPKGTQTKQNCIQKFFDLSLEQPLRGFVLPFSSAFKACLFCVDFLTHFKKELVFQRAELLQR